MRTIYYKGNVGILGKVVFHREDGRGFYSSSKLYKPNFKPVRVSFEASFMGSQGRDGMRELLGKKFSVEGHTVEIKDIKVTPPPEVGEGWSARIYGDVVKSEPLEYPLNEVESSLIRKGTVEEIELPNSHPLASAEKEWTKEELEEYYEQVRKNAVVETFFINAESCTIEVRKCFKEETRAILVGALSEGREIAMLHDKRDLLYANFRGVPNMLYGFSIEGKRVMGNGMVVGAEILVVNPKQIGENKWQGTTSDVEILEAPQITYEELAAMVSFWSDGRGNIVQ